VSTTFEALNPRGLAHAIELRPLARRLDSLHGKRIGLVNSWPADSGFAPLFVAIREVLSARAPGAQVVALDKPTAYSLDDLAFWDTIFDRCDAFVYATAPSASTTHYGIHFSAALERRGRPGVVVTYETLRSDALNSVTGTGMPIRWVALPYPLAATSAVELARLASAVLEQLVEPLRPQERVSGTRPAPTQARIACEGDYDAVQSWFHEQGWTDGLPVSPPTPSAVLQMLRGTSLAPDTVVSEAMGPEGWQVSVEKVAVNAVMAGCTPACLPIVLAAVEAFSRGRPRHPGAFSTPARATNSFSFMQVVNGPVRVAAGMNGGLNALGPGNRANASIGRALRLSIINLGGSRIGTNTLPVQGNPSAYSFAFAENEEASPWPAHAADLGFATTESALTLMVGGWSHVGNYISEGLDRLAADIAALEYPSGIALLISPPRARALAAQGMDKHAVEDYVWERAVLPAATFRKGIYWSTLIEPNIRLDDDARRLWSRDVLTAPDAAPVPVYPRSQIHAFVVGGEISPMMQAWKMQYPVTVSVDRWR
jgi:hypothetical protein